MEQYKLLIMLFVMAIVVAVTMGMDPLAVIKNSSKSSNGSNGNNVVAPNLNVIASI